MNASAGGWQVRLIKARTKKRGKKSDRARPTSEQAVNVAAEALMSNGRKGDVTEVLDLRAPGDDF